jgi:threonine/homoserine/homoserine lactone efflux protein
VPLHISNDFISNLSQFVSASQPLNALAYIFDGLHFGVSDFPYAACSMVSLAYVELRLI